MRKISLLLIISVLLSFVPAQSLHTSARGAILIDAHSGRVLFSQNASMQLPMASTTKIMTALVVVENADLDEIVVVDRATTGVEGSSIYLKPGEMITVRDLLYGLLLESGNDAALTLAVHVGGSEEEFVVMMNERAAALDLQSTSFQNPHGLDGERHFTTAHELAIMATAMLSHPELAEIASTPNAKIAGRSMSNSNKMLHRFDGADGVKTGFTRRSGRCLVSSATRDGQTLIAVTLNAGNDWNDHTAMLNYGFSTYKLRQYATYNTVHSTIPVIGGVWHEVDLVVAECLKFPFTDTEASDYTITVQVPRFVYAGVERGDIAGWITLHRGNEVFARSALVFDLDVEQAALPRRPLWQRLREWFIKKS